MPTAPGDSGRREEGEETIPLTQVPARQAVRIHHVGRTSAARDKLFALGLMPGTALSVVAARPGGAVVVEIGNRRLVLDHVSAESIEVDGGSRDRRSGAQPCG